MRTSIGSTVTFGRDGDARQHQLYGWFLGENGFTWTLRQESALSMPRPIGVHGGFVEAVLNPLTRPTGPRSQRVKVIVNGEVVGETSLASQARIGFYFPAVSVLDQHLVVAIQHPDSFRQGGPESPEFAFAVTSIRVLSLEEPVRRPRLRISHATLPPGGDNDNQATIAAAEEVAKTSIHDLMTSFQLVAGDCEFGGVQRACGSDPLGLFRFAGATPDTAINVLDCNFEGIGEDLDPYVAEHGAREWMMKDLRYCLGYHTRMSANVVSREAVIAAERRKVAFLRRMFREELEEGQKIFVCADRFGSPPEAMLPLFLALNRYGPNTLLWITLANDEEDVGRVEEVLPGLMRGYIDRFIYNQTDRIPSFRGWLSVLSNARLLHQKSSSVSDVRDAEASCV
jgi:hypothetical protein